ncbi:MAG: winged helix-turn-helix transcriptional regulator, partial [Oscillospiraceae bacterium]|nr:winged helix-turn-helix transcriptional regulator [Oscillospiraceae bacterium]
QLRKEGLNQKAIAEQLGISVSMVSYTINRMKPKTNAAPEAKTETKKEPAQAVAGQALTGNYNTTNIAQSEGVVKSFLEFPTRLEEFARQCFEDVAIHSVCAQEDPRFLAKKAEIVFTSSDKWYRLLVLEEKGGKIS